MITLRTLLFATAIATCIGQNRAAQPRQHVLTVHAGIRTADGDAGGAYALLFINERLADSTGVSDGGFTLDLPAGVEAVLEVYRPGCIGKRVVIQSAGIPRSMRLDCEIALDPLNGPADAVAVREVGAIRYDAANGLLWLDPRVTAAEGMAAQAPGTVADVR